MARSDNVLELPDHLPVPQDDGACAHLEGSRVPAVPLRATHGETVYLSRLTGTSVVYIYPRTGRPDQELPTGWNDIPGARGCTPQSCGYRDRYVELQKLGVCAVYGLSSQDSAYQQEAVARLNLPFEILSDEKLAFARALKLPTFAVDGMQLIRRITLIIRDGIIVKVLYPVFPPDRSAQDVIAWLAGARGA